MSNYCCHPTCDRFRHSHCNMCGLCGFIYPHHKEHCHHNHHNHYKPISHVNLPACGEPSMWKAIQTLQCAVNGCIDQTNGVMKNANETLCAIKKCSQENGAYYNDREIWTEQGYDTGASSTYTIIHKKATTCDGSPIKMELKLAYDNTTNSRLKQDAFVASEAELANLMVPAIPVDDTKGWYGHAVWNGAPIASDCCTNLYTVGFTRSGVMKYYDNAVDPKQLRKDCIENAMGCSGVLVVGGDIAPIDMRNQIPDYDKNVARVCMGQNFETHETIFLVCGDYDTNGLSSATCAAILKSYGCDLAVELCEGDDACALDKGEMLFVPSTASVPKVYAYWYVTKKRTYCSDFTLEVAVLMQKYGQAIWAGELNSLSIKDIWEQIKVLFDRTNVHEADIDLLKKKVALLEQRVQALEDYSADLQDQINQIVNDLGDVAADLAAKYLELKAMIEKEISDRILAIQDLQLKIDAVKRDLDNEVLDRIAGDKVLQDQIDLMKLEISDHKDRIIALEAGLQSLKNTVTSNYNTLKLLVDALRDDVGDLQARQIQLESQMTALDAALTAYIIELSDLEVALNNLKETVLNLASDVTNISNDVFTLKNQMILVLADITNLDARVSILEDNNNFLNTYYTKRMPPIKFTYSDILDIDVSAQFKRWGGMVLCEFLCVYNKATAQVGLSFPLVRTDNSASSDDYKLIQGAAALGEGATNDTFKGMALRINSNDQNPMYRSTPFSFEPRGLILALYDDKSFNDGEVVQGFFVYPAANNHSKNPWEQFILNLDPGN